MSEKKWFPAWGKSAFWDGAPLKDLGNVRGHVEFPPKGESNQDASSTTLTQGTSDVHVGGFSSPSPRAVPIPESPAVSVQLPPPVPSFDKNCTPSRAPVVNHGKYDYLSYDRAREQRKKGKDSGENSRGVLNTLLAAMIAEERKRTLTGDHEMDTSMSVLGRRERPPADVVE